MQPVSRFELDFCNKPFWAIPQKLLSRTALKSKCPHSIKVKQLRFEINRAILRANSFNPFIVTFKVAFMAAYWRIGRRPTLQAKHGKPITLTTTIRRVLQICETVFFQNFQQSNYDLIYKQAK